MKIVGYLKLNHELPVEAECLGKAFDINLDGIPAILKTPKLSSKFKALDCNVDNSDLDAPECEIQFSKDFINYGRTVSWPNGESWVYALLIEIEYDEKTDLVALGIKINLSFPKWISRFRKNLFIFGHNFDSPTFINQEEDDYHFDFYLKPSVKSKPTRAFSGNSEIIRSVFKEHISLSDFKQSLIATSENKQPILEYLLLKEAEISLVSENYRKSILDSATALELCLTNTIKREIVIDSDLLDEILRLNNSISKKRKLIKFTKQNLPNYNYEKEIEDLRNKAIHIGKNPTKFEAEKAFKISKEVIDCFSVEKFVSTL
jgi:hypothetical protein